MLVTTQKPDKTAFGMNGRSKLGFDVPIRALDLTLPEVRHLPNVGLGEPGGVSPRTLHHGVRGLTPLGSPRKPHCLPREVYFAQRRADRFTARSVMCHLSRVASAPRSWA